MQAQCYEAERSLFLQPVAEAVRAVALALPPDRLAVAAGDSAGTLAELVPELRRLLDLEGYERAPAELERRRSFEAVTAFVRGLAAGRPLLLVLDDLHLAGASTLELLHFLLRRLAGDRVLVLAAVRAEEGAETLAALADVGRMLELGPLPAAAVAELARRFGVADLAGPVQERTRATPCSRWRACGRRPRAAVTGPPSRRRSATRSPPVSPGPARRSRPCCEPRWSSARPSTLRWSPPSSASPSRRPRSWPSAPWPPACWSRTLRQRLRLRQRPGPRGPVPDQPRPTRIARHRRLASLLADRPEAAAGHAAAAGAWPAAAGAWMAAAATAAGAFANRDAERLLGQAVAAAAEAGGPALEASARLARGRVLVALGDYPGAFADQQRALELAATSGDDRLEAEALEQLGWTVYYHRDSAAASELTPQARELVERAVTARGPPRRRCCWPAACATPRGT